jgi:hypothetical protein
VAAIPEQLVTGGDFHENREVASRRDGHPNHRHANAERFVIGHVEAEAIVFTRRIPTLQLDDELDPLRSPRGRDAEQVLHVDQAEAPDLHVMPRQFRAGANQECFGPRAQFHRIVRHEAMAANNQIERALALADPAFTDDQHAQTEDVHDDAMDDGHRRKVDVERGRQSRHHQRCGGPGAHERKIREIRLDDQLRRWIESGGNHQARNVVTEDASGDRSA